MSANPSLTSLRSIGTFDTNKGGLDDTSLSINEVDIAKKVPLIKDKDKRWLSLTLLKVNKIYSLSAFVSNDPTFFLTILDNIFSYFWDL